MPDRQHKPVHPGQVLKLDFLEPMGITAYRLAKETGISAQHLGRIIKGKRNVTADIALRLARFFGTSAQVWMGLQTQHDLDLAQDQSGREIEATVKPWASSDRAA